MKVLTIDFDFIMSPCIKLYNSHCDGKENDRVNWEIIERELNLDKFLCYDAEFLRKIALLIKRNVSGEHKAKFIPIKEHHELIQLLPETTEKIDLLNVDFHHDIGYNWSATCAEMSDFDKYTCANWVGYLQLKGKLERYRWLKAPKSEMFMGNIECFNFEVLNHWDIDNVEADFDYVFFCLSPNWVPYKFQHLYDLLVDLFKEV